MEPRGETPPGSSGPLLPRRRRQTRAPRSYEVFVAPFAVQHLSLSVFRGGGGGVILFMIARKQSKDMAAQTKPEQACIISMQPFSI